MKRTIIKIDDSRCNGCGLCVKGCHEGALQLIEGKAVLVSELYCDGLGACLGECPQQAIELEEREAEAYDERKVMQRLLLKGEKVISAHLRHLATQGQQDYLQQAIDVLEESQKQAIGIRHRRKAKRIPSPHRYRCPANYNSGPFSYIYCLRPLPG